MAGSTDLSTISIGFKALRLAGREQAGDECNELGQMREGRGELAGIKCVRLVGLEGFDNHMGQYSIRVKTFD